MALFVCSIEMFLV
jgi:molybdopterin biosynthesis enzyme MoaB